MKNLITSSPALIFYHGNFVDKAMKRERITVEEIHSAGIKNGLSTLDDIDMIILETTGEMTIIPKKGEGRINTFENLITEPRNNEIVSG